MSPRLLPPALQSLVFLTSYVAFLRGGMPLLVDPDTPWHLMAGYKILELGRLPVSDPWSFTAGGHPWYLVSWAWDILLALVHGAGGMKLLCVYVMAVAALVMTLLARNLLARGGVESGALIMTLILAGIVLVNFATARPHLASFICILLAGHILHSRARSVWLLPVMLVWANTHGSFIVGFTMLGAYGLEALVGRDYSRFKNLLAVGAASLLVVLLNPYGINLFAALDSVLGGPMPAYINEWQPFGYNTAYGAAIWLIVLFALALWVGVRGSSADIMLSVMWFIAMLVHQRNASMFVLFSAPLMASGLQAVLVRLSHWRIEREELQVVLAREGMQWRAVLAALLVVLISLAAIDVLKPDYLEPSRTERNPGPAIAKMQTLCEGHKFLTDYTWSGRLIYASQGRCRVFIDGREGTAYPRVLLQNYIDFMRLQGGWQEAAIARGVDGIFADNTSAFARAYADGQYRDKWREIYRDEVASIYLLK